MTRQHGIRGEIIRTMAFAVIGALCGVIVAITLLIIQIPAYEGMPLTVEERISYDRLKGLFNPIIDNFHFLIYFELLLIGITAAIVINELNGYVWTKRTFATWTGRLKFIVVFLLNCAGLWVIFNTPTAAMALNELFIFSIVLATIWVTTAETGLAGDFTFWRPRSGLISKRTLLVMLLGATAGISMWGCYKLTFWILGKLLVFFYGTRSEGEISFSFTMSVFSVGIGGMALLFALSFGIIRAFTPRTKAFKNRLFASVLPLSALCLSLVLFSYFYWGIGKDFDLHTNGLVDAAGLAKESPKYSVIAFRSDNDKLQVLSEFNDMAFTGGFLGFSNMPASEDNIKRIQNYLEEHGKRTIYNMDIRSLFPDMLFLAWKPGDARNEYLKSASDTVLSRLLLFGTLHKGIPEEEALMYLDEFSDEKHWSLGPRYTYNLALHYARYGRLEKARYWEEKAKTLGYEAKKPVLPRTRPFIDGMINGKILLDGFALAESRLGLFWVWPSNGTFNINRFDEFESRNNLIHAQDINSDGSFRFDNIYEGGYYLALKVPEASLPDGLSSEISILNSPGVILINSSTPSTDLGEIVIQAR